nr:hypothetical protein [Deltaproteobacteria bacterium]
QAQGHQPLAIESHPRIVRLTGASAKRQAFAATRGGRQIGRLTEALLATLEEAGDTWPTLSWATVGHRVREHVIGALQMEGQWVNLAGPRARRLFRTETVTEPGAVAFIPADDPGRGWIRAGWLQGAATGDRWAVSSGGVDTEVVVESVGRNRSEVVVEGAATGMPMGSAAHPVRLAARMPVDVPSALQPMVEDSAWLCAGSGDIAERVVARDGGWVVEPSARWIGAQMSDDPEGRAAAVELLEQRARWWTVARCLSEHEPDPCPVRWSWSRGADGTALPNEGAELGAGDRVVVDLWFDGTVPLSWFISVVFIDPIGESTLLSASMPEGIELRAGELERLGVRRGSRARGVALPWPKAATASEGRAQLLLLASRRPLSLDHLVRAGALDDAAIALPGLVHDTVRGHRPEHARACAWTTFEFSLAASS